jgi:hypothetical protein
VVRLPILALLAALAVAAAGCGGDETSEPEGTPPKQWAGSVCGALETWQESLQNQARGLSREVLQAKSPNAAKRRIGTFLDEVIAETDTMMEAVEGAGQPAVEQGRQVADDFRMGLEQMRAAFEDARAKIAKVPTDDPQAFQRQLTEIGSDLQTQGRSIGDTLGKIDERYDSQQLGKAFDETEACSEFTG